MKLLSSLLIAFATAIAVPHFLTAQESKPAAKPLRILLITGGCCHDYEKQKDILKAGIEKRIHAVVDQVHTPDKSTKPPLAIFGNSDYAKGYDLVIHDECAASVSDEATVQGVLHPHKSGIPGVNLHCAMHSYRIGSPGTPAQAGTPHAWWFEYLGLQSSSHGPQKPISITHLDKNHPISKGLPDWTTVNEELYNNIQVLDGATPLARGKQIVQNKDGTEKEMDYVVAWTNLYQNKTRVFSTTIGHNNTTVEDDRYLDLVTRGVLWATNNLQADGSPKAELKK
jgi:hypothetical protein